MTGVSGSNLKARITTIIANRIGRRLSVTARVVLLLMGLGGIGVPLMVGAQAPPTERLAFEVASVKPNKVAGSNAPREVMQTMGLHYLPGGRFSARSVPIPALIFEAYSVVPGPSGRISVSPGFQKSLNPKMVSETYDIEAVAEKGAIPVNASPSLQRERIQFILQTLLADRFKVRIRRETKEVSVYAMVVGKNGPKLQKSMMDDTRCTATSTDKPQLARLFGGIDPASCHSFSGGPRPGLRGEAIDMSDLAAVMERFSDRPVLDHTGLTGLFKIAIPGWNLREPSPRPTGSEPTAENRALGDPGRPTISDVLQDLGLRLESTRAPVEMFVVEHFERPAQN